MKKEMQSPRRKNLSPYNGAEKEEYERNKNYFDICASEFDF